MVATFMSFISSRAYIGWEGGVGGYHIFTSFSSVMANSFIILGCWESLWFLRFIIFLRLDFHVSSSIGLTGYSKYFVVIFNI